MSRIGNNPIAIPSSINVLLETHKLIITSEKVSREVSITSNIGIEIKDGTIFITRKNNSNHAKSMHGTIRQLISNTIEGLSDGFTKDLEIIGVGYQASVNGSRLKLQLGFSHDIYFDVPDDIQIVAAKTNITVKGVDKQLVGAVAAKIRSFRKPEPYKGKGVRYKGEVVKIKQGKKVGE